MESHFHEPVTLEKTAADFGFSTSYFSRLFRRHFQMSFKEYVTALRLNRAMQLLRETNEPVIDVAYEAGFNSLRSFNRCFKQETGCTPSAFRAHKHSN